jgi:XTP/dITP diphosphohydrolase
VLALVDPVAKDAPLVASGACEGRIAPAPRGHGGFGYDPIFFFPPFNATFADVPAEDKHRVSHRGIAARAARALLGG